jgi:hypothetical protein
MVVLMIGMKDCLCLEGLININYSGDDFTLVLDLKPGKYEFQFLVDGEIRTSPDMSVHKQKDGNEVNVLEVNDRFNDIEYLTEDYSDIPAVSLYKQEFPDYVNEKPSMRNVDMYNSLNSDSYLHSYKIRESNIFCATFKDSPLNTPPPYLPWHYERSSILNCMREGGDPVVKKENTCNNDIPDFFSLNHLYNSKEGEIMGLSTTFRVGDKYVTIIFYTINN